MGIARSSYYYAAPEAKGDDTALVEAMAAICTEFEAYGWRRVQAALRLQGIVANHKKIKRLMHHVAGLQRRHRADRVLRLLLDPRHGAALARRSVRLPASMERAACAHGERATRHAPLDRHRRGHLPDGVASDGLPRPALGGAVVV